MVLPALLVGAEAIRSNLLERRALRALGESMARTRTYAELEAHLHRRPTEAELAAELEIGVAELQQIFGQVAPATSRRGPLLRRVAEPRETTSIDADAVRTARSRIAAFASVVGFLYKHRGAVESPWPATSIWRSGCLRA